MPHLSPSEFMHPEDAAALQQLESIPGFPSFVKSILSLGLEQLQYGLNMASTIRLSEQQLPHIYKHLPPICEKLGIDIPEFYLSMDPVPNACTFGDSRIFIKVTSGLLETMDDDELDAVLAHECGHVMCRHVLYHSVANYILRGVDSLGILGKLSIPIQLAFLYWQRKSELSCDRVGALVTSPEVVSRTMARLAAGPKSITKNLNLKEWASQADAYEAIGNHNTWNKALQVYAIAGLSHPFSAVRVREILKWGNTQDYQLIKDALENKPVLNRCPHCHQPINANWMYCQHCGKKIK